MKYDLNDQEFPRLSRVAERGNTLSLPFQGEPSLPSLQLAHSVPLRLSWLHHFPGPLPRVVMEPDNESSCRTGSCERNPWIVSLHVI